MLRTARDRISYGRVPFKFNIEYPVFIARRWKCVSRVIYTARTTGQTARSRQTARIRKTARGKLSKTSRRINHQLLGFVLAETLTRKSKLTYTLQKYAQFVMGLGSDTHVIS